LLQFKDDNSFSIPNSFREFLFNSVEQIHFQSSGTPFNSFILFDTEASVARLRMTLFTREAEAYSPLRSPFGSLQFDDTIAVEDVTYFVRCLDNWLIANGVQKVHVVSYPYCYNIRHSEITTHCLLKNGYDIAEHDMNFHLHVSPDGFLKELNPAARRRFVKYQNTFRFSVEESPDIESIYRLVEENRAVKGNPLSISLELLKKLYNSFKDSIKVFLLKDGDVLIGSAFGVQVSEKILYYYLAADSYAYKKYSPSTILIGQIYNYCIQQGIEIFDLGIATSKSIPNFGLIKFKQNMGGKVSLKLSFEKKLLG
jgi:hypothetical protein